jgi:hypothetical protein
VPRGAMLSTVPVPMRAVPADGTDAGNASRSLDRVLVTIPTPRNFDTDAGAASHTEAEHVNSKDRRTSPATDEDDDGDEVVVRLSVQQAEGLVRRFGLNSTTDDAHGAGGYESGASHDADVTDAVMVFNAAMAVIEDTRLDLAAELEAENVAVAVADTQASAAAAALVAVEAASHARDRNAKTVARAAGEIADSADQAAVDVRMQAAALAEHVAAAATRAAEIVAATTRSGGEAEAAVIALRLAAQVDAAAASTAMGTASAAAAVSVAVAAAATRAAAAATTAAAALEREAAQAAQALHMITAATARQRAIETDAKAVDAARTARRSRES